MPGPSPDPKLSQPSGGQTTQDAAFESLVRRVAGAPSRAVEISLFAGTVVDSKLKIDRVLGRGGMGVVYLADHLQLGRQVALKVTHAGATEKATARLLREARAMAAINHDNVITVYDVGTIDAQVFIAMEYVDGGTMRWWLDAQPRSWREIVEQYAQAGLGLAAAHERGLVHRDFKPDNVLVTKDGRVRVADFGLVRPTTGHEDDVDPLVTFPEGLQVSAEPDGSDAATPSGSLTMTGAAVGTPAYMSRERFNGEVADERGDQFSFCVAVFEALYGAHPFGGDSVENLAARVCEGRIVETDNPLKVPARVRRILTRGLSLASADRYPSMGVLLRELGRATKLRGRLVGAVVGALLVGGVTAASLVSATEPTCEDNATLREVWNDETRAGMRAETLGSDLPERERVWREAEEKIDDFVSGWEAIYREACAAPPAKRQVALSCLQDRANLLADKISATAGREGLRALGVVATGLAEPDTCRPLVTRGDGSSTESSAPARKRWQAAVRHYRVGQLDEAREQLLAIDLEDPAVAGTRTHGMALAMLGDIAGATAAAGPAVAYWRQAIPILVAVDDVNLAIQTSVSLALKLRLLGGHADEVRMLAALSKAWLERATNREWLESKVELLRARLARDDGRLDLAEELLRNASAKLDGPAHPGQWFDLQLDLGRLLIDLGRPDDAVAIFDELYAGQRGLLDPGHPRVGTAQAGLAEAVLASGDVERAVQLMSTLPEDAAGSSRLMEVRAKIAYAQGDARGALRTFESNMHSPVVALSGRVPLTIRAQLGLWQARAGEHDRAAASAAATVEEAAERDDASTRVEVACWAVESALESGDAAAAAEHLQTARKWSDALPQLHFLRDRVATLARSVGAAASRKR